MTKGIYQILSSFLIACIIIALLFILDDMGYIKLELFEIVRRLFRYE